jgi:putative transposase
MHPMLDMLALLIGSVRAALCPWGDLLVENLLLRHQLAVALRTNPRLKVRARDKLLWVLARRLRLNWRRHLLLVSPDTVVRWHRQGWQLFWRWKSRPVGRPQLSAEARALIARLARENPLWGTERIRGELLKLGIAASARSIRRYRAAGPAPRPGQNWRTFLANHRPAIWAADFFAVQTLTFRTLFVLLFVTHDRRELVHLNVTASPTAAWVWRQMLEATAWGRRPRFLLRDRDRAYGPTFSDRVRGLGVAPLLTPVRAPKANAIAERLVGTIRRECLDHLIVVNEQHLRRVLGEFAAYYNQDRPHRTLRLEPPLPAERTRAGPVCSRSVLGGLHHAYDRVA